MAKDGKIFEQVVAIIQHAFKDHSDTNIQQNAKIVDKLGTEREIDVLVSTTANGYPVCIVIECKDHSRAIKMTELEAFATKCENLFEANKKIFVSRKGFQSGCVPIAQRHDITLLTLSELSEADIQSWAQLPGVHFSERQVKIISAYFRINGSGPSNLDLKKAIFYKPDKQTKISIDDVYQILAQQIPESFKEAVVEGEKIDRQTFSFPEGDSFFIEYEGVFMRVEEVTLEFEISRQTKLLPLSIKRALKTGDTTMAEMVGAEVEVNGQKMILSLVRKDSGEIHIISSPKSE